MVSATGVLSLVSLVSFASAAAPYSYTGLEGPLHWGELDPSYSACSEGDYQSPINIVDGLPLAPVTFNFPAITSNFTLLNNGHYLELTPPTGSQYTANLNGTVYNLVQFHFHTPSEHHWNLKSYPLEGHFVFETSNGTESVVAFLFETDSAYSDVLFQEIVPAIPAVPNTNNTIPIHRQIDFSGLDTALVSDTIWYPGSLTTPPCTENIQWFISQLILKVSNDVYLQFAENMKFNARVGQNDIDPNNVTAPRTNLLQLV
jgi:carbonic anhydrase